MNNLAKEIENEKTWNEKKLNPNPKPLCGL